MPTLRRRASLSPSPLSVKALIVESWQTFVRTWKDTFGISFWLMIPAAALLIMTLLRQWIPNGMNLLPLVILFIALCVQAWVSLQLIRYVLGDAKQEIAKPISWQTDVAAYIWTKILNGIALVGSMLPMILGLIGLPLFITFTRVPERIATVMLVGIIVLLILPAIWLGVSLMFWPYVLASDGVQEAFTEVKGRRIVSLKKTVGILSASHELVRGRFVYTVVRLVIPGIIFGIVFLSAVTLVDTLIQWIAGPAKLAHLFRAPGTSFIDLERIDVNHTTGNAYSYFLQSVGEAVFFPLLIIWQAKLFQSLRSRK